MSGTQKCTQNSASAGLAVAARQLTKDTEFFPHADVVRRRKVLHMVEEFAVLDVRSQVFWLATALDSLDVPNYRLVETFLWNRAREERAVAAMTAQRKLLPVGFLIKGVRK